MRNPKSATSNQSQVEIAAPEPLSDLTRLKAAPSIRLGKWPTPLERSYCNDIPILVKRDDLSGFGRGGVKTRKIEYLMGHVLSNGYDEVITVVANVTNLAHDIVPAFERHGLGSRIFVIDNPLVASDERRRFFSSAGADVRLLGAGRAESVARMLMATLGSRARGQRPFVALPSLGHPSAVAGSASGFLEMVDQVLEMGEWPESVFITAASGTTLAGFLLAENVLREKGFPPIRVLGVQVHEGPVNKWVLGLVRWAEWSFRLSSRLPAERIEILASQLHGGFCRYTSADADLCKRVQSEQRLKIDPFFGGKTWAAMESWLAANRPQRPIVYWHCGYTPDWQAMAEPS